MRTLIFSNSYKPTVSGVVTSISMFRQGLLAAGHDVFIFAPDYRDYHDSEPFVFRFPALDLNESVNFSVIMPINALMSPAVHGLKPNLIHSQHPILMGGLAADFADELQVPLVFTFHSRYDQYARKYVPLVTGLATSVTEEAVRRYLIRCSHIITPTASVKAIVERDYQIKVPISVVPTPVALNRYHDLQPDRIRKKFRLDSAEILLYVGRLAEEKNLEFLLRAFARIARARPRSRLLLVGRGSKEKSLRTLCRELGLGKRVIFAGAIPHEDIPDCAAAADIFVFPSMVETQGLVLIEAMAAGTPVVAIDAPGTSDILAEGGGYLVPADERRFAETVLQLLTEDGVRRTLEEEALQVANSYTVQAATEKLLEVYGQALADGPRSDDQRQVDDRGFFETMKTALTKTQEDTEDDREFSDDFKERIRNLAPGNLAVEVLNRLLQEEIEELEHKEPEMARAFAETVRIALLNHAEGRVNLTQTLSELWVLSRSIRRENQRSDPSLRTARK